MFSPPGPLTINQLLYGDVAYDPAKFVPITLLARVPNVLITRNNLGATSVADLIALARADPGKLTYASQGVGSTAFLTAKLFETRADVRMAHVPYRGAGPAPTDIIAGHVDMMFDTIVTSLAVAPRRQCQKFYRHRKCRALECAAAGADIRRVRDAGFPIHHLVRLRGAARHSRFRLPRKSTGILRRRSRGRR